MLRPILHIGYPKTSSTWFQEIFYPNVENICYIPREIVQDLFLNPGAFDWNEQVCKEQLSSVTKENKNRIVICEELLSGRLRPGGVKHFITKEVANRLKLVFPEACIVLFIRNQIDAIASSYSQYLQAGGTYSIDRFIHPEKISRGEYNNLVLMGPDYFQYHKVLDYYVELFGNDNVHIFLYEDFRDSSTQFIQDYAKKFDLSVDANLLTSKKMNESSRALLLLPRRICNSFSRTGPLNKYYILHIPYFHDLMRMAFTQANKYKIFGNPKSSEKTLGMKNVKKFKSFFSRSNQILIEKYGLTDIIKYQYPL